MKIFRFIKKKIKNLSFTLIKALYFIYVSHILLKKNILFFNIVI